MTSLIFLTSTFPYPPGEQFIETEILYLEKSKFKKITVLPYSAVGEPRQYPGNIKVDTTLALNKSVLRYALKAPFTKLFINEMLTLIKYRKFSIATIAQALRSIAQVLRTYETLKKWIRRNGKVDVAYAYWNEIAAYAACLAKEKKLIKDVVSRAHGFDVYAERRSHGYMPLKRQFLNSFSKIFLLSDEAKNYFKITYGFEDKYLNISPLGVTLPTYTNNATSADHLSIVSVSFCVPAKRIDKIIDSLALFAVENPNLNIRWTHIGDGPLKNKLSFDATNALGPQKNINFEFKGGISNKDVIKFYRDNYVDFLINTSEFEGIPVSIMEAMAVGIPAIATDVGGVADLVNSKNGYLLCSSPTTQDIKSALYQMQIKSKEQGVRDLARRKIIEEFNAEKNYQSFVSQLETI